MKTLLLSAFTAAALLALPAIAQDQPTDALVPPTSASDYTATQLAQVIDSDWRPANQRARDTYRHPKETLTFFELRPDQTVIEITPGGGWYTQILAPLLRDNGHYIAAEKQPSADSEARGDDSALRKLFVAHPAQFGKAAIVAFDPKAPVLGPAGSADRVLTFRNVHNWAMDGSAPAMFKAFYTVLKPGGVLGVVDHRADAGATLDEVKRSGYLPVDYVVKLATDAGFVLDGRSEINANPKDDRDHPEGVWTLPPTLALGDKDKDKYLAIGESDRMTLRFVKPEAPAHAASSP
ncbi:class I SAM-dependent methyltransferase [Frateuria sp.]|uniref:class I SAM-dependent methyltransferase n=1 Tax=Frateuria sp. TaxID=2211372 RepID=UPI003F817E6A